MKDTIITMNNESIKKVLYSLKERYINKKIELENELKVMPKENLKISNGKNRIYRSYYKGTQKKICSKKTLITKLCRKYRIKEELKHINEICTAINTIIFEQQFEFIEEAKKHMRKNFQLMEDEQFEPNYKKALDWENTNTKENDFREAELKYKTKYGVRVRSKSEMIIGNLLEINNIRYIYELELKLGELSFHPDLTIMRKYDNKLIFWEHCGMDTEEYLKRHEEKLKKYKAYGISEDSNLIVTYEKDLAENNIENIINKFLK